jgi:predicted enzyme related to lactoylglutathione lyase
MAPSGEPCHRGSGVIAGTACQRPRRISDEFPSIQPSKRQIPTNRRLQMSKVASKLNLTQVGRVCVTVVDTDRAIDFYVDKLGFEKVVDEPMGPDMRWVEVAIPGTPTTIALAPPPPGQQAGGSQTGICLDTTDVDADHAALKAAGVDVDAEVAPLSLIKKTEPTRPISISCGV